MLLLCVFVVFEICITTCSLVLCFFLPTIMLLCCGCMSSLAILNLCLLFCVLLLSLLWLRVAFDVFGVVMCVLCLC